MKEDDPKTVSPVGRLRQLWRGWAVFYAAVLFLVFVFQRGISPDSPVAGREPDRSLTDDRFAGEKQWNRPADGSRTEFFIDASPKGVPLVGRGGAARSPAGPEGKISLSAGDLRASKGRVWELRRQALQEWRNLREGRSVELPWFGEEPLLGTVHLRMEDFGWLRFGGELDQGRGSFSLGLRSGETNGVIFLTTLGIALEIRTEPSGTMLLVERPLDSRLCWPAMAAPPAAGTADPVAIYSETEGVPRVNTKPGARGLIYLNFEGGVATDPVWNYGRPIAFAPSGLSASGILEVVERVAEDYAPFDVAVSTIWADYEAAPVGRRTRILVTPTSTALPGSGGVAMINAWSAAGKTMSSTVPGWVFTSTPKQVAEGVSHEAGHTFGLNHDGTATLDGRTLSPYYKGHGGDLNNPLSWAPIMGEAYTRSQTHWSRGEYASANNKEDDIALIKRKTNGVGYIDDSLVGVRALEVFGGTFAVSGVIHHGESTAVYRFATRGGILGASLQPKVAKYGNTDLKMVVSDVNGAVLAVSDPVDATAAQVNVSLPEGTYTIGISSGCTGPKPAAGYAAGYPTYGALGQYLLSGTVENAVIVPDLLSPWAAIGIVGEPFLHQLRLTPGAQVRDYLGGAPLGVDWDAKQQRFTGTPLMPGVQEAGLVIAEGDRRVYRTITMHVHPNTLPSLKTDAGTVTPLTTPTAPWRAQVEPLPYASVPGTKGLVVTSGGIADGGFSLLRYQVPTGIVARFWWKVSSESGCDFLECRVNGAVARDRETGAWLRMSGVTDWRQQSIQIRGPSLLEFVYRKDFSLSEEQDRGWLAGLEFGQLPVFTKMPQSRWLGSGKNAFVLEAEVSGATSYQWKKDGLTVSDGEKAGRRVSGALSAFLSVTGAGAGDSGLYVLEARNAFGMEVSRRVEVGVPGVPVVWQPIFAGAEARPGETLTLSVGVSCVKPFFVLWTKNGVPLRWTQSPTLQLRNADEAMSGRYSAVVVNAYGTVSAGEVVVQIQ
jgi:hypothetical protein